MDDEKKSIDLPCKEGDTLWFKTYKYVDGKWTYLGIKPHKINRIDIGFVCYDQGVVGATIPLYDIGKEAFLSKEEAEKALNTEEE